MSNSTFFVQECPTCGRRLRIRVEYLGKRVVCQHCRGQLVACDPASNRYGSRQSAVIQKADDLLKRAAQNTAQSRLSHPR
jgi:RNase P subunit RPR2